MSLQHHRILERLGATRVISPEHEMGVRISQELNYPMVHDYLNLGDDYFVVEFQTTEDLIGKTLGDLIGNLPVSALVAKRMKTAHTHPDTSWDIQSGDRLVLGGQLNDLRALIHRL